jgi:hypothetical protein
VTTHQCTVSVREVGTDHAGEVHLYKSRTSTGEWWVCDGHAEGAPARGIWWLVRVEEN